MYKQHIAWFVEFDYCDMSDIVTCGKNMSVGTDVVGVGMVGLYNTEGSLLDTHDVFVRRRRRTGGGGGGGQARRLPQPLSAARPLPRPLSPGAISSSRAVGATSLPAIRP